MEPLSEGIFDLVEDHIVYSFKHSFGGHTWIFTARNTATSSLKPWYASVSWVRNNGSVQESYSKSFRALFSAKRYLQKKLAMKQRQKQAKPTSRMRINRDFLCVENRGVESNFDKGIEYRIKKVVGDKVYVLDNFGNEIFVNKNYFQER